MPPQTLIDAVKARAVVPFVGSGLSVSVGRGIFPDWKGLIERLAERLAAEGLANDAAGVRAHLAAKRFPEAAELAFEKLTPSRFGQEMRKAFEKRSPPGADLSAVEALWRLRPPIVLTTNYDSVLRWPFETRPGIMYAPPVAKPRVAHNDDPDLLQFSAGDDRPLIWHLHGSVDRPSTMILTKQQYERLYAPASEEAKKYAFALDQLRTLVATRSLLYVGFSLDDPFVSAQLKYILDLTSQQNPVSFVLLKKGEKDTSALLDQYHVQVIEFEEFGGPMARAINEIAEAAWGPLATGASVPAALVGLVDDLVRILTRDAPEPAVAARAFNRWKPEGWPAFPLGGDGVKMALEGAERLAGAMRQSEGYFPLLEFVREVAARSVSGEKQTFTNWIETAADALAADAADSARLKTGGFAPPGGAAIAESYVLVRLEESGAGKWRVQGWLFNGREAEKLFKDEWELVRSEFPTIIYELLDRIAALELRPDQTTVAFMVSRSLLVEALDQVQPAVEFMPEPPIGVTVPVTVRPVERLKFPKNLRQLGVTWQELKLIGASALALDDAVPPGQSGSAVWLRPSDAGPSLKERLEKNRITCAVLAAPPLPQPPDPATDLLNCVLQAAVPAVVWLREPAAADLVTARARIEELLKETTSTLPYRVWLRRQQARGLNDPSHPGQCLVLLWDDADRLPPDRNPANRAGIPRA